MPVYFCQFSSYFYALLPKFCSCKIKYGGIYSDYGVLTNKVSKLAISMLLAIEILSVSGSSCKDGPAGGHKGHGCD